MGLGQDSAFGLKTQATYGTAVAVDRFYRVNSVDFAKERQNLDDETIRYGQRFRHPQQLQQGMASGTISVSMPFYIDLDDKLLEAMVGKAKAGTAGTAVSKHEWTHDSIVNHIFTLVMGITETDSTTIGWFQAADAWISSWTVTATASELVMLNLEFFASDITDLGTAPTIAHTADVPYKWSHASATVAGVANRDARSVTITSDPGAVGEYLLGDYKPKTPVDTGEPSLEWVMEYRYDRRGEWDTWKHNTTSDTLTYTSNELGLTAGTKHITFASPSCLLTADPTPNIGERGLLYATANYQVMEPSASSAHPLTVNKWTA